MSVFTKNNKWWIDLMVNRTRYRRPSPDNTKSGALAYEALVRQKVARGEELFPKPKPQVPLFKEFAKKWFEAYVKVNNKPSEIKSKKSVLKASLLPFFSNKRLNEITSLDIEQFKAHEMKLGLNPKTINNHLGNLGKCLRCAVDWEIIHKVPIMKPLKVPPDKFDYLIEEEAESLLAASSGVYHTAILIALHTGLRFGELMALTWKNVDFHNNTLIIEKAFLQMCGRKLQNLNKTGGKK